MKRTYMPSKTKQQTIIHKNRCHGSDSPSIECISTEYTYHRPKGTTADCYCRN
ncbi:hypothetical protein Hanom_Chr05g00409111 [Helianthus anomalus]